jgi:hypothetical protein
MSLSPGGLSKFDWGYKSKDSNNTSDGGYKKDIIVRSFFNNIHNIVSKAQYVVKYEFKDLDKLAGALIDETYHKVGTNKSLVDVGHGIMRIAVQHHAVMEGIRKSTDFLTLHGNTFIHGRLWRHHSTGPFGSVSKTVF